jgi:hypothetical protein
VRELIRMRKTPYSKLNGKKENEGTLNPKPPDIRLT